MQETKLKVMEALQEEAYKGIVRIDAETMHEIGVRVGDIIEIEGNRKTVGIVDRAYPTDVGQSVIRMDGILRRNAKTGIGETIKVRKSEIKEAQKITIAPAQDNIMIQAHPNVFKRGLLGRAVIKGDMVAIGGTQRRRKTMTGSPFEDIFDVFEQEFMGNFGLGGLKFVVANTSPKDIPVIITETTELEISPKAIETVEEKILDVTYEDIGGLRGEIKKIREMVELPLKHPELFERLGIEPPRGVLLHGPPGTGKTLLAKAVANESDSYFILINGPEITSKFYGESEKRIRELFEEAEKNAPSIIFIDEIDAIAPKREETYGEVERRMVAQLLATMDGLKSRGKVVVIGATNRPNAVDPALRRPGRFDREISISVPNKEGRLSMLKIHTRNMPLTKDVKLDKLAEVTHGFVGADVSALCKEAAMNVLRRILPKIKLEDKTVLSRDILEKLQVTGKDFEIALKSVRPSAMREVLIETPNTTWDDIGGLEDLKQELKEAVEWPLKNPGVFDKLGVKPPKGILIYGPPGSGKTLLAKAVARESGSNFILIKGPELLSKWVGESEKGVRKIFEKARQASPTIIFFDEIDSITSRRGTEVGTKTTERMVNQLLTEIDGLEELTDVVVMAATNRPDLIDPALLRAGRFDRIISTTVPNKSGRLKIFGIHTKGMPLDKDVNLSKLAEKTESYTGADIQNICREAAFFALRENMNTVKIKNKHFEDAFKKVKPSLSEIDLKLYKTIEEQYIRAARSPTIRKHPSYTG
ncbi:ATPase [archaeon]|nr:ATPase [archaeon]